MKLDPLGELIQRLVKEQEESIPLADIMQFLDSSGIVAETDTKTKCRALAAYLRKLLEDEDIKRMIRATQEARYLSAVREELLKDAELGNFLRTQPRVTLGQKIEAAMREIKSVRNTEPTKLRVIERVARLLRELGCTEEFVLPTVEPQFPDLF